jgi:hypothetical protein
MDMIALYGWLRRACACCSHTHSNNLLHAYTCVSSRCCHGSLASSLLRFLTPSDCSVLLGCPIETFGLASPNLSAPPSSCPCLVSTSLKTTTPQRAPHLHLQLHPHQASPPPAHHTTDSYQAVYPYTALPLSVRQIAHCKHARFPSSPGEDVIPQPHVAGYMRPLTTTTITSLTSSIPALRPRYPGETTAASRARSHRHHLVAS